MAIFSTNLEVIHASEKEIEIYYEEAAKKINLLLEKYNIRNIKGEIEQVSADELRTLLAFTGFFQPTPLKTIFFDQKQQFVPQEIILAFRSIISNPPVNIKAIFFDTFLTLLTKKGWDEPLSSYFEKQYNVPLDGVVILDDLKDFSLGFGVYRVTFQIRVPHREKITVFLKKSDNLESYNELFYSHLQKELLPTASYAKMPHRLSSRENKEILLLSPAITGVASDTALSMLTQAYRKTTNEHDKFTLKKALEILIDAFISHAALGDMLGRNDRHLMNSLTAFVVDGILQKTTPEDLNSPIKILDCANNIIKNETKSISLVAIDLKWLLGEKNTDWALVDIDFGLSELNLLSLLEEFNDYNLKINLFFEKRREYVTRYYNMYCQNQEAILVKKDLLFTAVKKIYPADILENKLELLLQRINLFENNQGLVIELFKRYLLNFRTRLIYKATLTTLASIAQRPGNINLFNALLEADLLKYLPPQPTSISYESSVSLKLQCFRGALSENDMHILSVKDRITWESIAANISMIAEKFNSDLYEDLENKKRFIKQDTAELLKSIEALKKPEQQLKWQFTKI